MRFTLIQAALFRNEISFVHMAPTAERCDKAQKDFLAELLRMGTYYTMGQHTFYRNNDKTIARFMVCTSHGASTDHVPVLFMDGKKSEFNDQRAYDEARHIPAAINGIGPMVVR